MSSEYVAPGVFVHEIPTGSHAIVGASTADTAFLGWTQSGPILEPTILESLIEFEAAFGASSDAPVAIALRSFFENGGERALVVRLAPGTNDRTPGAGAYHDAIVALARGPRFNLLCIPPDPAEGDVALEVLEAALRACVASRAILLIDAPAAWSADPRDAVSRASSGIGSLASALGGQSARNAAVYFPRLLSADPLRPSQTRQRAPAAAVAGVIARTDRTRGVWKAPAGRAATVAGSPTLAVNLTDTENQQLNGLAINCLRTFGTAGTVIWGARTLRGADQSNDDYKYLPVRRLALYIEDSVDRGLQWATSEANDDSLWARLRGSVGGFMHGLFKAGAFQGLTPNQAFFVKCDRDTTPQIDLSRGILNVEIGFAPLRPAEFVVIRITLLMHDPA